QHRRLKGQPGPGRRLVEERRHDAALQAARSAMGIGAHLVGPFEEFVQQPAGELLRLDDVPQAGSDCHEKASFPASQDRTYTTAFCRKVSPPEAGAVEYGPAAPSAIQWPVSGMRIPVTLSATSRTISSTRAPVLLIAPPKASTGTVSRPLRRMASRLSSTSWSNPR